MQPHPILLYRRRWTLFFQVPFAVLMAILTAYAIFMALVFDDRLFTVLFSFAAFCTFCLAWTLGRGALEAHKNREPAVVIDETGITDLRDEDPQPVPWEAMERVRLDSDDRIVVRLHTSDKVSALRVISLALQRWQQGGDVVVSLAGLAHNPHILQRTLSTFHKAAAASAQTPR
ncbi:MULTISPECIES: hypothetical protein [Acidovorax]|uniref:hypothetical protein n=1 Tax=Acidovorax TaxID=12916 RepID=UPI00023755A8|nr:MULTISPECIES: hypothetical protein [Acidovorax]KRD14490.1 hypothetical protein ASE39_16190 [Acidovorax sp. Root267]